MRARDREIREAGLSSRITRPSLSTKRSFAPVALRMTAPTAVWLPLTLPRRGTAVTARAKGMTPGYAALYRHLSGWSGGCTPSSGGLAPAGGCRAQRLHRQPAGAGLPDGGAGAAPPARIVPPYARSDPSRQRRSG